MSNRLHFASLATAVAMMGSISHDDVLVRDIPRRKRLDTVRPYESEMNRKQSRAASRSSKQYLLKGVRP